jgi:hypothetical protein
MHEILPQKIGAAGKRGPELHKAGGSNDAAMIGQSLKPTDGSFVVHAAVANGMSQVSENCNFSNPNSPELSMSGSSFFVDDGNISDAGLAGKPTLVRSLEQTKGDTSEVLMVKANDGQGNAGLKISSGVASSSKTNGNKFMSHDKNTSCSLSLIESPFDEVAFRPPTEEVIAFGGIPKPTQGVRSSSRLGGPAQC